MRNIEIIKYSRVYNDYVKNYKGQDDYVLAFPAFCRIKIDDNIFEIHCKQGFLYDGASVPAIGRMFIERDQCLRVPSFWHDLFYHLQGNIENPTHIKVFKLDNTFFTLEEFTDRLKLSREESDYIFYLFCVLEDVPERERDFIYRVVKYFGQRSWDSDDVKSFTNVEMPYILDIFNNE